MGGQACVFYGAAEFSRDTDIVVLAAPDNLDRLTAALDALQAECIAVPPFEPEYLARVTPSISAVGNAKRTGCESTSCPSCAAWPHSTNFGNVAQHWRLTRERESN